MRRDKKFLDLFVHETGLRLIGEYQNVNGKTVILGHCLTEECEGEFEKIFRDIYDETRSGPYCDNCICKKSTEKRLETNQKKFGVGHWRQNTQMCETATIKRRENDNYGIISYKDLLERLEKLNKEKDRKLTVLTSEQEYTQLCGRDRKIVFVNEDGDLSLENIHNVLRGKYQIPTREMRDRSVIECIKSRGLNKGEIESNKQESRAIKMFVENLIQYLPSDFGFKEFMELRLFDVGFYTNFNRMVPISIKTSRVGKHGKSKFGEFDRYGKYFSYGGSIILLALDRSCTQILKAWFIKEKEDLPNGKSYGPTIKNTFKETGQATEMTRAMSKFEYDMSLEDHKKRLAIEISKLIDERAEYNLEFFNHSDSMVESENHKIENRGFLAFRNALKKFFPENVIINTLDYQQADFHVEILPTTELGITEKVVIKVQSKTICESCGENGGSLNIRRKRGIVYDSDKVDIILGIDNRDCRSGKYVCVIPVRDTKGDYLSLNQTTIIEMSQLHFSDTHNELVSNSKMFCIENRDDVLGLLKTMTEASLRPPVSAENRRKLEVKLSPKIQSETEEHFQKLREKSQIQYNQEQIAFHKNMIESIGKDEWIKRLEKIKHLLKRYNDLFDVKVETCQSKLRGVNKGTICGKQCVGDTGKCKSHK